MGGHEYGLFLLFLVLASMAWGSLLTLVILKGIS